MADIFVWGEPREPERVTTEDLPGGGGARRATAAGVPGAAGGGEAGQRVRQGGVPLVHGVRRLRSAAGRCVLSGGRGRYGHVAFAARACRLVHARG